MEETTIKISLEKAREIFKEGNKAMNSLLLENFTEEDLKSSSVKSWKEVEEVSGFYVDSDVVFVGLVKNVPVIQRKSRAIFRTLGQAQASLALSQLSQLIYIANEGWEPDWMIDWEEGSYKYCICYKGGQPLIETTITYHGFLAFKTKEIAKEFLEKNRELIEQAKPLL